MLFGQLYESELRCYQQINDLLGSYDFSKSYEAQTEIFIKIQNIHRELAELQKSHIRETLLLKKTQQSFWVNTVNHALIPPDRKGLEFQYLQEEYFYFITKLLVLDGLDEDDNNLINSLILKLISQPKGQELILELNRFGRENPSLSFQVKYGKTLSVDSNRTYNKKSATSIPITIPRNFITSNVLFFPGKDVSLVYEILFIAFGHELIHCLNFLKNKNNRSQKIPCMPTEALYHLYDRGVVADKEEYDTIEMADLSENSLRGEHKLPLRGGHIHAESIDRAKMIELAVLSKMRKGVTDFKNMHFPEGFTLPCLLDASKLEFSKPLMQVRLPSQFMPRLVFS